MLNCCGRLGSTDKRPAAHSTEKRVLLQFLHNHLQMPEKGRFVIGLSFPSRGLGSGTNPTKLSNWDSTFLSCITIITGNPPKLHTERVSEQKYHDEKMLMAINHAHVHPHTQTRRKLTSYTFKDQTWSSFFFVADILPLTVSSEFKSNANQKEKTKNKMFNVGMNKRRPRLWATAGTFQPPPSSSSSFALYIYIEREAGLWLWLKLFKKNKE